MFFNIKLTLGYICVDFIYRNSGENSLLKSTQLILKDFYFAMIGLFISIAIAIGVNDQLTFSSMLNDMPEQFVSGLVNFFSRLGFSILIFFWFSITVFIFVLYIKIIFHVKQNIDCR